jgi:hypothetical protein
LTSFPPRTSPTAKKAASPNGTRIYAGGGFTSVSGIARAHVVAIGASRGRVDRRWNTRTDLRVYSLTTLGPRVYLGGRFREVNGHNQHGLAAVDGATGKLSPQWTATAEKNVRVLVPSPKGTRIYAGGQFEKISGKRRAHLAALDPLTGAPRRNWRPNPCYPVFDLVATTTSVYVAGGGAPKNCNAGGLAQAFRADNGASRWRISADGDFQAVALLDGTLYYGGHFIEIPWVPAPGHGRRWLRFAAVEAATGELDAQWKPTANRGVWAMTAAPARGQLYVGGAFTQGNDLRKQGFAQFSVR